MLTTIHNGLVDRRTTLFVVYIVNATACILLVAQTTRSAAVVLAATGGLAWGLVSFLEWRRRLRQQTWAVRSETDAAPMLEDIDRPESWRRRALTHLGTWLQAVLLVWLVGLAIILVGIPIALIGRGAIELVSWIAGALG
jgi:hypothetical protein